MLLPPPVSPGDSPRTTTRKHATLSRYRAAGQLQGVTDQVYEAAQRLAAGKPACEAHLAQHGGSWQPHRFVALCDQLCSGAGNKGRGGHANELTAFAEGVMAAELHALLRWCYSRL